jgi:sarcosine oxidase subunit alpha
MNQFRITNHPILSIASRGELAFRWNGQELTAREGDTIASALFANGIRIFGHHPKDGFPQGIFCANGQCSQCMVIADGKPVKSCMEMIHEGMNVLPSEGLPTLPQLTQPPEFGKIESKDIEVLIIGGGPAGLSAGIELGKLGVQVLLVDDKQHLGGKLVLQTHRFFGSTEAVYAGTRGIDIATRLENEVREYPNVIIWTNSTALAAFSDKKIGILKNNNQYMLIQPTILLVTSGARERFLNFKGNTLPGVYGAGAFQTLVNRDLVKPANRLFVVGGGNVGLIAGYHALQAGIEVACLVEALPECGGYKVHRDKLVRLGVPIYTSHTIISANGNEYVQSVTIAKVDKSFKPIPGTEKSFVCDSVLIAVGLEPVNEIYLKAKEFNIPAYAAGDTEEVAEASAAIFSGKIKGLEIAKTLKKFTGAIPKSWYETGEILRSKPGHNFPEILPETSKGVSPVLHCTQEIPCNPCSSLCMQGLIKIATTDIREIPKFIGNDEACKGCLKCVIGCPGLAITLVDSRREPELPLVSIPFEFGVTKLKKNDTVTVLDTSGNSLGSSKVISIKGNSKTDRTWIVQVQAPRQYATRIAGIRVQEVDVSKQLEKAVLRVEDDLIVCRCERVTAGEIRDVIRRGFRDLNEIKAVTRAGMGACGAKTCNSIIHRLFKEEGIPSSEILDSSKRPLFVEVPLGTFAGINFMEKPNE